MANEGVVDSTDLVREIRKRIKALKEECHFESDYVIKFAALGTGGFLAEQLYTIGREFSSDPFFFIQESASLELDLMMPVVMRQNGAVANIRVSVETLNGVTLDRSNQVKEYVTTGMDGNPSAVAAVAVTPGKSRGSSKAEGPTPEMCQENFLINDIATDSTRHIMFSIKLPKKHKKLLKGKDAFKIDVRYKDSLMCARTVGKLVTYAEIPVKDKQNDESDVIIVARQECRRRAAAALERSSVLIAKLDRVGARAVIQATIEDIHNFASAMSTAFFTCEDSQIELDAWADRLDANLQHCERFIGNFAVRWDDAWGRVKALQSSLAREVPSTLGVFQEDQELFAIPKVVDAMHDLSDRLRRTYKDLGLSTTAIERYEKVIPEPVKNPDDDEDGEGEEGEEEKYDVSSIDIAIADLKKFTETAI